MNKYLSMLIVLFVCNNALAQIIEIPINLYDDKHFDYLVTATNVEIGEVILGLPINSIKFWRTIDADKPSEIIYRLETPNRMLWANFSFNSEPLPLDGSDFFQTSVSSNGVNWTQIDFSDREHSYGNFSRDVTVGGTQIYLKTYSQGAGLMWASDGKTFPLFRSELVPEASALIYLLPFAFLSIRRRRQNA